MAIRKLYEPEKNDNYTDKTFIDKVDKMAAMKTPGHFSYIILAYKFDKVVQQISSVFATILLFDFVSKNRKILAFGHYKILATEFAAMASFYFFFVHFWNIPKLQTSHFVEMFVFHLLLAIFTPILKNLTFYYSDSAIWSLVSFCFVTNVVFHEYAKFARIDGPEGLLSVPLTLSEATSLNAAISGCVILSSRLDSNSDVIFFLTLAFQIFVFSPIFFRILRVFKISKF
ncbi:glycosylphosphatidylinositol anchor biosynthesis [Bonamia ostreae]|uniref:Glycosylphosphatidylinositol anchor biosynthesis n=1 Tax=Bonamia ostreae TaxID=126728 RepID=A0ABV2APX2_9EUKA